VQADGENLNKAKDENYKYFKNMKGIRESHVISLVRRK
jgi:hypothetical protein